MNIGLPEQINRKEWLTYLHVKGEPKPRLLRQMNETEQRLLQAARPKGGYRILQKQEVPMAGRSIQKHLAGCEFTALLAVTIGPAIDQMIEEAQKVSMMEAILLDTGASVLAEQTAELAEITLREQLAKDKPGYYGTSRFSPGYGDYPVSCQKPILELLDAERTLGIRLTEGNMMVPCKSVTALLGMADHPVTGHQAGCNECILRETCVFLKEGRHC